jgi:hypothetical protein
MKAKISIGIILLLMVIGCKTTRTVPKTDVVIDPSAQLVEKVQITQPQYKTLYISKMTIQFVMNEQIVNVSANCKIIKDSAIHISFQPFLGIELFKAELTPESVKFFDKTNHKLYAFTYESLSERFGVELNFNSLQSLITNQLFCVGSQFVLPDKCKITKIGEEQSQIEYQTDLMLQQSLILPNFNLKQVVIKSKINSYVLETNYNDFKQVDNVSFPHSIALIANNDKSVVTADFTLLKIKINGEINLSFVNPQKYTLAEINDLLKK